MEPNKEAILNAKPYDIYTPKEGLFRGIGNDDSIFLNEGGKVMNFDIRSLLTDQERSSTVGAGNQNLIALPRLKEQYGIDFNNLSKVNMGDYWQQQASTNGARTVQDYINSNLVKSDINSFVGKQNAGLNTVGLNTAQQLAGIPEQFRAAELASKNPPTGQTVESGIKNLGIPQTNLQPGMTGDAVKQLQDYLVANNYMTQAQVNTGYGTYGPQTTAAVKALQAAKGVNAGTNAGYFGPQTRSALTQSTQASVPSNISSSDLTGQPLALANSGVPKATAASTFAGSASVLKSIDDYIKFLTPPETEAGKKASSLEDELGRMLGTTQNRGADQLAAEQAQGVAQKKQELQNYKTQLGVKTAEYQAIQAKYDAANADLEGRPVTMDSIIGGRAQINRVMQAELNTKASEIAIIQANVAGATDNLNLAQDAANRAVDLKYEDAESAINRQIQQLELWQGKLSKEEGVRSDAITMYLNDQKEQIAAVKASEKELNNFALDAMGKYRDAGIQVGDSYSTIQSKIQRSATYQAEQAKKVKDSTSVNVSQAQTYSSDLDAIIGSTLSTIPTKFGQEQFQSQLNNARNDSDKISLVAAQVLKGQSAEFKNDFRNQAVGIASIDKAIAELDAGIQTGVINNAKQYIYNLAGKDYDPALAKIQGYITSAIQPYRNSVTGAAWGEQEDAEYQSLFGSTKYSPTELRQRLVQTKELLKSKSAEGLNAFVNPLNYYDNQFDSGGLQNENTAQTTAETIPESTQGFFGSLGSWLFGDN